MRASRQQLNEGPHPLGEYLRSHREAAALSIRALAEASGIHHSFMSRLEAGQYAKPSPEILQRFAKALDLPAADLFALVGYELPEDLPTFPAYLRSKYDMTPEAAKELEDYFAFLAERHGITEKQAPRAQKEPEPQVSDIESADFDEKDLDRFRAA